MGSQPRDQPLPAQNQMGHWGLSARGKLCFRGCKEPQSEYIGQSPAKKGSSQRRTIKRVKHRSNPEEPRLRLLPSYGG